MATRLEINRPVGVIIKRRAFTLTPTAAKEMYHELGYKLRLRCRRMGGRPKSDQERCPCGAMTLKRAVARNHKCPGQADPAIPQQAQATENTLLPITVGEYKTRRGHRAFVERTETALRYAYGFSEFERNGKVYQQSRTWGMDSGKAILSHGRSSQAFDLVARILKKE